MLAHWWSPTRPFRTLAAEGVRHGRAWLSLVTGGPKRLANFGDAVNPAVLRELTGHRVTWAPLHRAEVVCIGSLLDAYVRVGSTAMVLGSGCRQGWCQADAVVAERVLSVRGELTARVLGLPDTVPLGDPGLVVASLLPERRPRRGGALLVPHFAVPGTAAGRAALRAARAAGLGVVLPNEPPLLVAERVRAAECVVTSSLHALVFAHALGTPVQLVSFEGGAEPRFKYDDYLSVFGLTSDVAPVQDVLDLPRGELLDRVADAACTVSQHVDHVVTSIYAAASPLR